MRTYMGKDTFSHLVVEEAILQELPLSGACSICRQLAKLCQLGIADLSNTMAVLDLGPSALDWHQYLALRKFAVNARRRVEQARSRLSQHQHEGCRPDQTH